MVKIVPKKFFGSQGASKTPVRSVCLPQCALIPTNNEQINRQRKMEGVFVCKQKKELQYANQKDLLPGEKQKVFCQRITGKEKPQKLVHLKCVGIWKMWMFFYLSRIWLMGHGVRNFRLRHLKQSPFLSLLFWFFFAWVNGNIFPAPLFGHELTFFFLSCRSHRKLGWSLSTQKYYWQISETAGGIFRKSLLKC